VLVLSRREGESILVHMRDGHKVDVRVNEIVHTEDGQPRVKLGISAPNDVLILRAEVPMAEGPRVWVKEATND
jgi:carbon storage regulator CsrA